jgi:hypothetical protein
MKLALVPEGFAADLLDDELTDRDSGREGDLRRPEIGDLQGDGSFIPSVDGRSREVDEHPAAGIGAPARLERTGLVLSQDALIVVLGRDERRKLPFAEVDAEGSLALRDQDFVTKPQINSRCLIYYFGGTNVRLELLDPKQTTINTVELTRQKV